MRHRVIQHGSWLALAAIAMTTAACSAWPRLPVTDEPGALLEISSQFSPETTVANSFDTCLYRFDTDNHFTVLLINGSIEAPIQAITLRLRWRPIAAKTPITPNATNMMMRYMVFDDEQNQVGVYTGAGYLYLDSDPGADRLALRIWQATLRLADHSSTFSDKLIEAQFHGQIIARRDDEQVTSTLLQLNVLVTKRLGYPRFVSTASPIQVTSTGL